MRKTPELTTNIAQLLQDCPACANVFNERGMACVGCDLSSFDTVEEAARVYSLDAVQLLAALRDVVTQESDYHRAT